MGRLGKILELLYAAPRTTGALHIRARRFDDHDVVVRAHEARQRASGGGGSMLLSASRETGPDEPDPNLHELWWAGPQRWRHDAHRVVSLQGAEEQTVYSPLMGVQTHPGSTHFPHGFGLVEPRLITAGFDVDIRGTVRVAGRRCRVLDLTPRSEAPSGPLAFASFVFGDAMTCHVDAATGVVVAAEARFEGEIASSWTSLVFDTPRTLDPAVFDVAAPDGPTKSMAELQAEHLRSMGVDLTGVDTSDMEAMHKAMHRHHFPPRDPVALAAQHIPVGPPPDDPVTAEASVRAAFAGVVTPSEDGEAVPAVEGGSNLGPSLRQAGERAPGNRDQTVVVNVEHVKFVSPDEAVVWFGLAREDGGFLLPALEGRAHKRGDRWLVSRATFQMIVGGVNVRLPPPPAEL